VRGLEDPEFAGDLRAQTDYQVLLGLRAAHTDEVPLVRLGEDQLVLGLAEAMSPDLEGPPGVVDDGVEQVSAVGGPGGARRRAGDRVIEDDAGLAVLDADRVPLVAGRVDGPGEQPVVVAEAECSE